MRIVSLLPEATAILAALGLADRTVSLPVTAPEDLSAALMAARPRLIFAAETPDSDGIPRPAVRKMVARMRPRPAVYALEPHTIGDLLSDIKTVGDATGCQRTARLLIEGLRVRIDAVTLRSAQALAERPPRRVALLATREPPVAAGWWHAELIGLAGGWDVLAGQGRPPRPVTWAEIQAARPDLLVPLNDLAGALSPWPDPVSLLERLADLLLGEDGRTANARLLR